MIFPFLHSFSIQICFDCTLDVPSLYYLPIHFKSYIEALKFKSYIIIPNLLYIVLLNIVCAYYTIQVFVQSSALFLFPKCFCLGLGDGEFSVQDEQLSSHSMHLSPLCEEWKACFWLLCLQKKSLGLLRADYLLDTSVIKQVEVNSIASSLAGIAQQVSSFHR